MVWKKRFTTIEIKQLGFLFELCHNSDLEKGMEAYIEFAQHQSHQGARTFPINE